MHISQQTINKFRASSTFGGMLSTALSVLLLLQPTADAQAGCYPEVQWQNASTNRMRCGIPGFLTNDTYYSSTITELLHTKTEARGTATYRSTNTAAHTGGNANVCIFDPYPCSSTSGNFWTVEVPFQSGADLTCFDGGPCDKVFNFGSSGCSCNSQSSGWPCVDPTNSCSDLCLTAFNQLLTTTSCGTGGCYCEASSTQGPTNFTLLDNMQIKEGTRYYGVGESSYTKETITHSGEYTLTAFADDALAAARGRWVWGQANPAGLLATSNNRRCISATMSRYRIKFSAPAGKKVTIRWDLYLEYSSPVAKTIAYIGLSWNGTGTGGEMYTGWHELPEPQIDEMYQAEVVNIRLETEGEGCSTCGDDESPGDGPDGLASVRFSISLGAGNVDDSAGALFLEQEAPSALLSTPEALQFNINASVVTVVTNANGTIDLAAPTMLARIAVSNSYAYWVHCSAKVGSSYETNSPFISHLIINPHGSTNTNTLRHVRFRSGSIVTNEFTCDVNNATNKTWTLVSGNGLKGERLAKVSLTNESRRLESYSIFTPANQQEIYRRDRLYWVLQYADRLLSETIDPAGLALMTTNTYDTNARLQLSVNADGSWERREHDTNGWLLKIITPFTNQPPTAANNECRVTEFSYASVSGSPDSQSAAIGEPRVVVERARGELIRKTMYAYTVDPGNGQKQTYTRINAQPDAAWDDTGNENTRAFEDAQHRPVGQHHVNGTWTLIEYTDNTEGRLTVTRTGPVSTYPTVDAGTRVEEQVDTKARVMWRKTYDIGSNILLASETYSDPDMFGRPTKVTYLDGTTSIGVKQDCCQSAYEIDRAGVQTDFAHDALKRLVATSRLGITISNVLDAADRLVVETRKGTNGNLITLRGVAYDAAGRVLRETNALEGITSYSRIITNGQRIVTITNPDGGTRIETYFRDGELASLTGTAVFPVRYEYAAELEVYNEWGDGWPRVTRREIKLDASGEDTAEWTKTYDDGLGRNHITVFANAATNLAFLNNKGQLWKQRDPDGVVTLFGYNSLGERAYTCLDSNRNDVIDFEGEDRITEIKNDVVASHGTNVVRTRTYVWDTDGSGTSTLLSTVETSVEGFKRWQTIAGAVSTSVKSLPSSSSYTVLDTARDGAYSISLYQNGRLASVTQYASDNAPIGKTTYGYDAHGRQSTVTDPRNGTTTFTFNNADQVVSVTTPAPGNGAPAQTTTTQYDNMVRATNVVQPDGTSVMKVFSPRGEVIRSSGSRTYPVGYAYDAQGRLKHMTNWSSFSSGAGARVTTWHYDTQRGWLTNKVYADGLGPKYSYTAAGRLSSRLWARGTNTTYSYNDLGDLSAITYDDGTTPAVSYSYTRRGQQETAAQGGDSWKLFYTVDGQLLSEAGVVGVLGSLRVTNAFDAFLRRTQITTFDDAAEMQLTAHAYGYDLAGRLSTVADGAYSAAYSYLANSPLISQITFKSNATVRLTTSKSYDNLNRLTQIASVPSAVSFSYSYNNANQRTRVHLADGSFWVYEYDSFGQVKSGKRYWSDWTPVAGQQFEYGFDDIGNRTSTKAGGNENGSALRSASYSANNLNQVTQRDVPGGVDVLGAARGSVTVNSDGTGVYRRNEYFRKELSLNNSSAALWQSVSVSATDGSSTNQTGNLFLPQTPEAFSYDADGNLTNDGRWAYVWDAENRLLSMIAPASAPSGSRKALHFMYDASGRRISKVVSNWTGSAWVRALDEKYLYDNWNLIAVLNATNNGLVEGFFWGLDTSGSTQAAGGVGGLLGVNGIGQSVRFATYDGNGNVAGLINADGIEAARYEYGPFGEEIRTTGTMSKMNPFRFSTKYQDDETGLLYYGYRYYGPSTGRWLSRDPIEEESFIVAESWRSTPFGGPAEILERLRKESVDEPVRTAFSVRRLFPEEYLFTHNDPITKFDVLGLAICKACPGIPMFRNCRCGYEPPVNGFEVSPRFSKDCNSSTVGTTATLKYTDACFRNTWGEICRFNCEKHSCKTEATYVCSVGVTQYPGAYVWKFQSYRRTAECP
jgi:RHS repeat-associated protein